jgi:ATP-dependent Clp protease ATP-binding subunit ClpB
MDLERWTQKAREALLEAQRLAQEEQHAAIEPAHVLLALARQPEGVVPAVLTQVAGSPAYLIEDLERELRARPRVSGEATPPGLSRPLSQALEAAEAQARSMKDEYVSTEHLLLALDVVPRDELEAKIAQVRGGQRVTSQDPEGTYQALEKFGRDLTELAERGKLDPVIGRDEEIRRVIQVLSRRT